MSELVSKAVGELERELARRLDACGAVAAGWGRAALLVALEAAGVRRGEVLLPELVCAQVSEAVRRAGARPVFYAVEEDLTILPERVAAAFTPESRAVVVVHYYGRVQEQVAALAALCRQRGAACLEDCALALGAARGGRPAGAWGDAAVFSFTKSDWCPGGGAAIAAHARILERMRAAAAQLAGHRALNFHYGLLRRADYAANRPRRAPLAGLAGRLLQSWVLPGAEDFYQAGRYDAAMPGFAARRAARILRGLEEAARRRRAILQALRAELGAAGGGVFLRGYDPGDSGAFLLLRAPGAAEHWAEVAARAGVTLRRMWPACQPLECGQDGKRMSRWAEDVLLMEVSPRLSRGEVRRIAATLVALGAGRAIG